MSVGTELVGVPCLKFCQWWEPSCWVGSTDPLLPPPMKLHLARPDELCESIHDHGSLVDTGSGVTSGVTAQLVSVVRAGWETLRESERAPGKDFGPPRANPNPGQPSAPEPDPGDVSAGAAIRRRAARRRRHGPRDDRSRAGPGCFCRRRHAGCMLGSAN